jgi:hypothetical protein
MKMSSAGLDVRTLRKAVLDYDLEHPRRLLLLCHPDDLEAIKEMAHVWEPLACPTEVRTHKFCPAGRAYILQHPDDTKIHDRVGIDIWSDAGGARTEESPPIVA